MPPPAAPPRGGAGPAPMPVAGARPRAARAGAARQLALVPLSTFHLVARLGSVSRAARELGISQPAVTQQIRRLERSVGLALFDRIGRRIVVTDAGRTLDTFAQRIFHLLDAAREAMDSLTGLRSRRTTPSGRNGRSRSKTSGGIR